MKLLRAGVDRIGLSGLVLDAWEATGGPAGFTPTEKLRLLEIEMIAMARRRGQNPVTVDELFHRQSVIADRLKTQIN